MRADAACFSSVIPMERSDEVPLLLLDGHAILASGPAGDRVMAIPQQSHRVARAMPLRDMSRAQDPRLHLTSPFSCPASETSLVDEAFYL
jgi:hypothetical protein